MRKLQLAGVGALALALSSGAIGAPKSDQAFLTDAIQGDLAEVQMGKLAVNKGLSEGVKEFGITLADDHTKALEEAAALAKTKQIAIPTSPKPDAQKMYEMLSKSAVPSLTDSSSRT